MREERDTTLVEQNHQSNSELRPRPRPTTPAAQKPFYSFVCGPAVACGMLKHGGHDVNNTGLGSMPGSSAGSTVARNVSNSCVSLALMQKGGCRFWSCIGWSSMKPILERSTASFCTGSRTDPAWRPVALFFASPVSGLPMTGGGPNRFSDTESRSPRFAALLLTCIFFGAIFGHCAKSSVSPRANRQSGGGLDLVLGLCKLCFHR